MIITQKDGRSFYPGVSPEVSPSDPLVAMARKVDRMPPVERRAFLATLSAPAPMRRDVSRIGGARPPQPQGAQPPMLMSGGMGAMPGFDGGQGGA